MHVKGEEAQRAPIADCIRGCSLRGLAAHANRQAGQSARGMRRVSKDTAARTRFALRRPHALHSVIPQRHFGVSVVPQARHWRSTGSSTGSMTRGLTLRLVPRL